MKGLFLKISDSLSLLGGNVGAVLTAIAIVIMLPEVISRYGFGYSFISVQDLVWFLCGIRSSLSRSASLARVIGLLGLCQDVRTDRVAVGRARLAF